MGGCGRWWSVPVCASAIVLGGLAVPAAGQAPPVMTTAWNAAVGGPTAATATADGATADWDAAAAADYLDGRQEWWLSWPNAARDHDTSCVSCHTSVPFALARPALRARLGESSRTPAEDVLLAGVETRVTRWSEVEPFYPDQTVGLPKTSESRGTEAILNALVLASRDARGGHLTDESRQAFDNMWKLQFTRGDEAGAWAWLHFGLAPWESDGAEYFGAALAAVAVGMAPEGYASATEIQERLTSLRGYLARGIDSPRTLDRVMLLWASTELPDLVTREQERAIVAGLVRRQRPDGGWSLTSLGPWKRQDGSVAERVSDGYATGLIAFVLQRAGVAPEDAELARALAWLVDNQDPGSGAWPASSLNRERDPESDRGRFMSDAATAFAVLALLEAEGGGRD